MNRRESYYSVLFTCWASRAGGGKADILQVIHSTVGVKGGSEGAIILTLQLTWVVTSTKEEQSANFEPQVTKARMVLPSTNRSCLLLPVENLKYIASHPGSLRTFLGFDDKLVPIGIADTVKLCLTYFLPSTVYWRFCQCNGCNSSQISSRPSLQTHRSIDRSISNEELFSVSFPATKSVL